MLLRQDDVLIPPHAARHRVQVLGDRAICHSQFEYNTGPTIKHSYQLVNLPPNLWPNTLSVTLSKSQKPVQLNIIKANEWDLGFVTKNSKIVATFTTDIGNVQQIVTDATCKTRIRFDKDSLAPTPKPATSEIFPFSLLLQVTATSSMMHLNGIHTGFVHMDAMGSEDDGTGNSFYIKYTNLDSETRQRLDPFIDLVFQDPHFPDVEAIRCGKGGRFVHVVCGPRRSIDTSPTKDDAMSVIILRSPAQEEVEATAHLAQLWLRHVRPSNRVNVYEHCNGRTSQRHLPAHQPLNQEMYSQFIQEFNKYKEGDETIQDLDLGQILQDVIDECKTDKQQHSIMVINMLNPVFGLKIGGIPSNCRVCIVSKDQSVKEVEPPAAYRKLHQLRVGKTQLALFRRADDNAMLSLVSEAMMHLTQPQVVAVVDADDGSFLVDLPVLSGRSSSYTIPAASAKRISIKDGQEVTQVYSCLGVMPKPPLLWKRTDIAECMKLLSRQSYADAGMWSGSDLDAFCQHFLHRGKDEWLMDLRTRIGFYAEINRKDSFTKKTTTTHLDSDTAAREGYFYSSDDDTVKCIFCSSSSSHNANCHAREKNIPLDTNIDVVATALALKVLETRFAHLDAIWKFFANLINDPLVRALNEHI